MVPDQPQSCVSRYEPSLSGEIRVPRDSIEALPPNERKVIARRAASELQRGNVVNLGVGMADGVAAVLAEEGRLDDVVLTVEQGLVGGVPARGVLFGAVWNPDAIIEAASQFDFYDGGGLDVTCLGFAEVDESGNVNASRVGAAVFGAGGFINISQAARKVVFCGTLTSGSLDVGFERGELRVRHEGKHQKFVKSVRQVTFSADRARRSGQQVLYVTERAVFELGDNGVELTEIAPGADLETDICDRMAFRPLIRTPLALMDSALFGGANEKLTVSAAPSQP